jgi:hypothetical protein
MPVLASGTLCPAVLNTQVAFRWMTLLVRPVLSD